MHAQGQIAIGETRIFESITGSQFTGSVARTTKAGPHEAIVARVGGRAYYCGRAEFIVEEDDPLGRGFLVR
jgi:trans-L-3-hydroxyproline dehydratase